MRQDIFSAGTAPGSPTTENEIKTLVCYLLSETGESLTFEGLHEALREYNLVNYFELVGVMDSLVESEHIIKEMKNQSWVYVATPLGMTVAETLDTSLPLSVREKAVKAVEILMVRKQRLAETITKITPLESGGFQVELSIPEGETHLVAFSVYAPTKEEAEKLRNGFLNDPVFIYQSVMSLLKGDISILGDLRPTPGKLF